MLARAIGTFFNGLAEPIGYELYIEGDTLHFHEPRLGSRPRKRYEYFYGVGDLLDFQIKEWRTTDRPATTQVSGRDPVSRKNLSATGSNSETTRDTQGNQGSLLLKRGEAGELVAGSEIKTSPETTQAAMTQQADADFKRTERNEVKATAKIIGDPSVVAKENIEIVGISSQLSGLYYIQKAIHSFTDKGYIQTLELKKNALGSMPMSNPPTLDSSKARENTKSVPSNDRAQVITRTRSGGLKQTPK